MARGGVKNVKIVDKDRGFKRLVGAMGELGAITIGVQGDDVDKPYPGRNRPSTVGIEAARHELGLKGMTRRSWLVDWIDENAADMKRETTTHLRRVLKGTETRTQALQKMGFKWTKAVRDRMADGGVHPPISSATVERKGHDIPLIRTYLLHNHVTYKIYLPRSSSIKSERQRAAIGRRKK